MRYEVRGTRRLKKTVTRAQGGNKTNPLPGGVGVGFFQTACLIPKRLIGTDPLLGGVGVGFLSDSLPNAEEADRDGSPPWRGRGRVSFRQLA